MKNVSRVFVVGIISALVAGFSWGCSTSGATQATAGNPQIELRYTHGPIGTSHQMFAVSPGTRVASMVVRPSREERLVINPGLRLTRV